MNRSGTLPSQLLSFFLFLSKLNNLTASSFYIFCLALKFYSSAILIFLTFFLSPPPLTPSWRQVSSRFKPIKTSTSLVGLFRRCFKRWSCKFTRVRHSRTFLHFRTCGNENCQWKPGSSRGWIINTILGPLRLYSYPEWRTRFLAWFSTSALDMCVEQGMVGKSTSFECVSAVATAWCVRWLTAKNVSTFDRCIIFASWYIE